MSADPVDPEAAMTNSANAACPVCRRLGKHYTTKNGFHVHRCPRCLMLYTPCMTPEIAGDQYYQMDLHWLEGCVSEEILDRVLALLCRFREPEQSINTLDFGTGNANLPRFLRGYGYNSLAVDIVKGRTVFPWWYYRGTIFDAAYPEGYFHLVTAIQVFEHLPDPAPVIEELFRITRPGGLIYIHTDMEVPEREADREEWYYIDPPHHCSIFRHHTFEVILTDHPQFSIEHMAEKEMLIKRSGGQ